MSAGPGAEARDAARNAEARGAAQSVADRAAAAMLRSDRAAATAGLRLVDVSPGAATVAMRVEEGHVNGHGVCHGGFLFLLADSAMAYACNSHGVSTLASGADIAFLRPARLGDELVARAVERALAGRSGLYDVTVRTGDGPDAPVVAEFRGRTRQVPGLAPPT